MFFSGWTVKTLSEALARGERTSYDVTKEYLQLIKGRPQLNAYLSFDEDAALAQADAADERRQENMTRGVLDGIPLAIKDNICIKDGVTTAGSRILEGWKAPYDATVITKLKAQGAVMLGKTNLDEFAMGSSTEFSAYGPTQHPRDPRRVPGGSSGGSAAAVAADLCVGALGSDTGGSIRQPAAFCGLVGLKPTYGRVSRYGLIAMASSLDQIGPMTKTSEDASILLRAMEGVDPHDQTTVAFTDEHAFQKKTDLRDIVFGVPRQIWGSALSDGVKQALEFTISVAKGLGAEIKEVDLPYIDEALAVYYVLVPCEVSSNLARFDGIRYGTRRSPEELLSVYRDTRADGFGDEVKRRILMGTFALSKGSYDAYYAQANRVRKQIMRAYDDVLKTVDALLLPTTPDIAFLRGEKVNDPLALYLEDVYTVGVNVAGVPAVSFPCETHDGMPVGAQLIGRRFEDQRLLSFVHAFETVLN